MKEQSLELSRELREEKFSEFVRSLRPRQGLVVVRPERARVGDKGIRLPETPGLTKGITMAPDRGKEVWFIPSASVPLVYDDFHVLLVLEEKHILVWTCDEERQSS